MGKNRKEILKVSQDELLIPQNLASKISDFELPQCVVIDLDDTLWEGNLDCSAGPPFKIEENKRRGVGVCDKAGWPLYLYPDVCDIVTVLENAGVTVTIASRTITPDWCEVALGHYKTKNGSRFNELFPVKEMYNKAKDNHLTQIMRKLSLSSDEVIFYDNEFSNIARVSKMDVTSVYTPNGLHWDDFYAGIVWHNKRKNSQETDIGAMYPHGALEEILA